MKETIKHYFSLALTALCAVFAISILFSSFSLLEKDFNGITQKNHFTSVAKLITAALEGPLPTIQYVGSTILVGDAIPFERLFQLHFPDGSIVNLDEFSDAALYLVDVKNNNGNSVLTRLSSSEISALENLPSTAIYDKEKHLLYFHDSGIYTLYIRLYLNQRPGILYECSIPVEMR